MVPRADLEEHNARAPEQTRRAQRYKTQQIQDQAPSVPAATSAHLALTIDVSAPTPSRYPISVGLSIGPQDYLPMEDEAPWPDLASVAAIQVLAEDMRTDSEQTSDSVNAFLSQAHADGLLFPNADINAQSPWRHLLSMYAHFAAELTQTSIFSPYDLDDFEHSRQAAQEIIAHDPDSVVAEYARLLELEILRHAELNDDEYDYVTDTLRDILQNTEDDLVRDAAVGILADEQLLARSPALQTWAETHIHTLSPRAAEVLAVQQINVHTQAKRPAETSYWMDAYRRILDERCQSSQQCARDYAFLNTHEGRLAADWNLPTNTWQAALVARIIQCHKSTPLPAPINARVTWTGALWSPSSNIRRCFTDSSPRLAPLIPTIVELEVIETQKKTPEP